MYSRDFFPPPVQEPMTFCNAAGFAGVQYYSRYWRTAPKAGSTDWIDAEWNFKVGAEGQLQCDFIQGLIEALGAVQPEFEAELTPLAEGIDAVCQNAMDHAN